MSTSGHMITYAGIQWTVIIAGRLDYLKFNFLIVPAMISKDSPYAIEVIPRYIFELIDKYFDSQGYQNLTLQEFLDTMIKPQ